MRWKSLLLSSGIAGLSWYFYYQKYIVMPSLAAARSSNAALKLTRPVSVVIGGTAGIGAAMAVKVAQYSTEPEVHIVGRNETAAQGVIDQMKAVNPNGNYHFQKCDLTLLSSTRQLTSTLRSSIPKISHLVLSPGILTMNGRTETAEGNDIKMMLHYYSRYTVIRDLLPNLTEDARVMSVLDAKGGNPKSIDWDDLDLKKGYSLRAAAAHCITMNDMMMDRLGKQHPSKTFFHAYPSVVDTPGINNLPWYARGIASFTARTFGVSADQCAEWLFYALNSPTNTSTRFVDNHGEDIKGKVHATDEQLERAWKHTEELVNKA